MYGPVIQGSNFRLRPLRPADAEVMIVWFEDLEVTARLGHRIVPSLASELEWVERCGNDPNLIHWGVEHEDRLVGTTGLIDISWANQHASTGTLIGDKTAWGKGIAGEMMRRRADYAFLEQPFRKLKSGYLEGNVASARAQAAAGYREVGRLHGEFFREGRWIDMILTELLREDWERRRQPSPDS
jgi:[ribosomal protein S5]-alanine N-acetyltransferase